MFLFNSFQGMRTRPRYQSCKTGPRWAGFCSSWLASACLGLACLIEKPDFHWVDGQPGSEELENFLGQSESGLKNSLGQSESGLKNLFGPIRRRTKSLWNFEPSKKPHVVLNVKTAALLINHPDFAQPSTLLNRRLLLNCDRGSANQRYKSMAYVK